MIINLKETFFIAKDMIVEWWSKPVFTPAPITSETVDLYSTVIQRISLKQGKASIRLYDGQNAIRLRFPILGAFSSVSSARIYYTKPDGTSSYWVATIEDSVRGSIYYDMVRTEHFEVGEWVLWPYLIYSDGRVSIGDAASLDVIMPGTIT